MPRHETAAPASEASLTDIDTVAAPAPSPDAPSLDAAQGAQSPTLDDAFMTLCAALRPHLDEDVAAQLHCDEIRGWYTNGNVAIAWTHAITLLEGVVGVPLRMAPGG